MGGVGHTQGHPNLFVSMSKMDFENIFEAYSKGGGGCPLQVSVLLTQKKSFQTYTLPSPHPLVHPWPCKHKANAFT